MYIQETFINLTREAGIGETPVYEAFTDDRSKLYRHLVHQYGRCTGKVNIDTKQGTKAIGWVFVKRMKYSDSPETYLQETWVTLHEREPEVTVTKHYAEV